MTSPIELAIDADTYLGETPIWSVAEQCLYWINCEHPPQISRWNPATGERRDWPMPERIGGLVLKAGGGAIVTLADGLYDFDIETGELALRVASPLPAHVALHECQCDRDGRLWVGAINTRARQPDEPPGGGKLFRLDGDRLVPQVDGISCANGLAFSPDGETLYLTDSRTQRVDAWTLDRASGDLSDRRTFLQLSPGEGFVDGATVDADGNYWATLVYAGAIRCYAPDGTLLRTIDLPFENPTKVAIGGPDMRRMFVTTTRLVPQGGAPGPGAAMHGGIYAIDLPQTGLPDPLFRGA